MSLTPLQAHPWQPLEEADWMVELTEKIDLRAVRGDVWAVPFHGAGS
jgi:hypothetical protein